MSDNPVIPKLGKLKPLELREVWASEPYSFTPWLAQPDNLNMLADVLGLGSLELVSTEVSVSEFSVDIVAKISGTGEIVAIENQLEKSDHIHLGQSIAYAAGTDAKIVIWVTSQFKDGHIAALDWLNRKTTDDIAFFGVEVSAVRIGDSLPAPRFDVIVKPNEWARLVRDQANAGELTPENEANLAYWAAYDPIAASMGVRHSMARLTKGWNYYVYFGRSSVGLSAFIARSSKRIGVYAYFIDARAPDVFAKLLADRAQIEQEVGESLTWRPLPQNFHIAAGRKWDPDDQAAWPDQHQWLAKTAAAMRKAFEPRLADLGALQPAAANSDVEAAQP